MNQPTKAFLIELRNLCHAHGVDFSADSVHPGRVSFTSTDESRQLAAALGMYDGIEANFEDLRDLEYQLAKA